MTCESGVIVVKETDDVTSALIDADKQFLFFGAAPRLYRFSMKTKKTELIVYGICYPIQIDTKLRRVYHGRVDNSMTCRLAVMDYDGLNLHKAKIQHPTQLYLYGNILYLIESSKWKINKIEQMNETPSAGPELVCKRPIIAIHQDTMFQLCDINGPIGTRVRCLCSAPLLVVLNQISSGWVKVRGAPNF
ncbi:uncharacterized protein LOC121374030 isoform X2 [Gigantopelta aegis]|uniref:uncharacterized protein LOC121374030 isoform X2 n=1 Tax=Gigantopelta aegis TaxID=1735272 RepID=UPI001B8896A0|nr:uncharacterized protein LOC121374030 isoform X2 [Gigantopelta aegis]